MILPDSAIRAAVYTALTGSAIVYSGHTVEVFDSIAPDEAAAPYVILDGQQSIPTNPKDRYGYKHYFTLRVVDVSVGEPTGRGKAESVLSLVLARVLPSRPDANIPLSIEGWDCWQITSEAKDMTLSSGEGGKTKYIFQKIVVLTLNIHQGDV